MEWWQQSDLPSYEATPPAPTFGFQDALAGPPGSPSGPGPDESPWWSRAGSGLSDFAGKVAGGLGREFSESPLSAFSRTLGLGTASLGIANQFKLADQMKTQQGFQERAQARTEAAAAPAVRFGTQQLDEARQGKVAPAMQAMIDQWKQQAKADMRARLASMGLGNSTDLAQMEAQIDQMGLAMLAQIIAQQESMGIQALQVGAASGQAGEQGAQQQQQLMAALIQGANQQLARLAAQG